MFRVGAKPRICTRGYETASENAASQAGERGRGRDEAERYRTGRIPEKHLATLERESGSIFGVRFLGP